MTWFAKLLTLALVLTIGSAYAQPAKVAPVLERIMRRQDNVVTTTTKLTKQNEALAREQKETAAKTQANYQETQEIHERLQKSLLLVSSAVRNCSFVVEIPKTAAALIQGCAKDAAELKRLKAGPQELSMYPKFLKECSELTKEVIPVLSPNQISLTDAERFKRLGKVLAELTELKELERYYTDQCRVLLLQQQQEARNLATVQAMWTPTKK